MVRMVQLLVGRLPGRNITRAIPNPHGHRPMPSGREWLGTAPFQERHAMRKNRVRHFAIATLLAAAAAVGAAQPASAQEPVSLPAGVACSFPLTFTVTG